LCLVVGIQCYCGGHPAFILVGWWHFGGHLTCKWPLGITFVEHLASCWEPSVSFHEYVAFWWPPDIFVGTRCFFWWVHGIVMATWHLGGNLHLFCLAPSNYSGGHLALYGHQVFILVGTWCFGWQPTFILVTAWYFGGHPAFLLMGT